jgi:hypothetical protein
MALSSGRGGTTAIAAVWWPLATVLVAVALAIVGVVVLRQGLHLLAPGEMAACPKGRNGLQTGCNPLSSQVTNSTWFAKNACDFNGEDLTTNLGVRSSNLFGRATTQIYARARRGPLKAPVLPCRSTVRRLPGRSAG